jgi:hypothetical protein
LSGHLFLRLTGARYFCNWVPLCLCHLAMSCLLSCISASVDRKAVCAAIDLYILHTHAAHAVGFVHQCGRQGQVSLSIYIFYIFRSRFFRCPIAPPYVERLQTVGISHDIHIGMKITGVCARSTFTLLISALPPSGFRLGAKVCSVFQGRLSCRLNLRSKPLVKITRRRLKGRARAFLPRFRAEIAANVQMRRSLPLRLFLDAQDTFAECKI